MLKSVGMVITVILWVTLRARNVSLEPWPMGALVAGCSVLVLVVGIAVGAVRIVRLSTGRLGPVSKIGALVLAAAALAATEAAVRWNIEPRIGAETWTAVAGVSMIMGVTMILLGSGRPHRHGDEGKLESAQDE